MWNFKYFFSPVSIDDKCHKKDGINKEKEDMECIIRNRTQNKKQIRGCSHNGCKRIFRMKITWKGREQSDQFVRLCDRVDYSPPESSVHRVFQARILKWVPFPSPGVLPNPGIKPRSPALQADSSSSEPPGKTLKKERKGNRTVVSDSLQPHGL